MHWQLPGSSRFPLRVGLKGNGRLGIVRDRFYQGSKASFQRSEGRLQLFNIIFRNVKVHFHGNEFPISRHGFLLRWALRTLARLSLADDLSALSGGSWSKKAKDYYYFSPERLLGVSVKCHRGF